MENHRPGGAISIEGETFIESSGPAQYEVLTAVNAARLRAEYQETYRAGAEATVAEFVIDTEDVELGGVRTLRAKPPVVRHPECGVLYLFGGAFVLGGPVEDLRIAAPLAAQLGACVDSPYYRLAPEHPFPAALDDATAAYQALVTEHGADQVAVVGESAGGNIALATVLNARDQGFPLPAAVAVLSPACDLTHQGDSFAANEGRDPSLSLAGLDEAARAYADDRSLDDPLLSPVFGDYSAGFPATLVTTGTRDLLLSNSARLTTVMRRSGVATSLHVWEGMGHVFEYHRELPEARESVRHVGNFLAAHLGIDHIAMPGAAP